MSSTFQGEAFASQRYRGTKTLLRHQSRVKQSNFFLFKGKLLILKPPYKDQITFLRY